MYTIEPGLDLYQVRDDHKNDNKDEEESTKSTERCKRRCGCMCILAIFLLDIGSLSAIVGLRLSTDKGNAKRAKLAHPEPLTISEKYILDTFSSTTSNFSRARTLLMALPSPDPPKGHRK
ncbi:hypothetical protein K470DRAFT_108608 [Piedraia hortae CBS 480.64]|uniref:Uncharacterized protein n=1 Tax=Piedraia hortae CBS 480.64 TaxID=1314780 RepID=A0A6A7BWZ1_9PEZI|nr:hypothetical protein K470DRAFT_108608 [Piedraia hortae CBS 480.64]